MLTASSVMTMRSLPLNPVFDESCIHQIGSVELAQKAKSSPRHWQELMSIETADLYLDRIPEAIHNPIKESLLRLAGCWKCL
jgi:hypothetical protein